MVGEILRQAREAKCLTQRDIAQNTNLLLQVVADLENDDFRRIPAAIYGRGFIKLYAEYVGLPPDQVDKLLLTFKQQYDGAHAPPVRTRQVPQQPQPPIPEKIKSPFASPGGPASLPSETALTTLPSETAPATPASETAPATLPSETAPATPASETAPATPSPRKSIPKPSMGDDGLLPLFAALHEHGEKDPAIPQAGRVPAETPDAESEPSQVKPSVSVAPVHVKDDFAGPVVPPENQEETDEGDDLFTMAKRLTQLRNAGDAATVPVVSEESASPVSPGPKPLVLPEPGKIVLPETFGEEAGHSVETEKADEQEPVAKPLFFTDVKKAVRISWDRITQAAHRSLDASARAIQPAKSFFDGRKKAALLCVAGAVALLLLLFGIHYLFQVSEQRFVEQETATSLPPPELYLD